ncbi:MAG TPA: glycoside hydrolase family 2 TIM barrel-domain containing protein [Chthoniobacterales bacterium]
MHSFCGRLFGFTLVALGTPVPLPAAQAWQPAGEELKTRWSEQVRPDRVLPEYPRPELERTEWQNLNGLWDYAITDAHAAQPAAWEGEILVPFCVESALSGVKRRVTGSECLWYHRRFTAGRPGEGRRLLLHFGASDWQTTVTLNGHQVGSHTGGYDPFTFDLTPFLAPSESQDLVVQVTDGTDGAQPRGKQSLDPKGIFYTPTTGLWQTVWLEPVPDKHLDGLLVRPDLDRNAVTVTALIPYRTDPVTVIVNAPDGRRLVEGQGVANAPVRLVIPDPRPWTPGDPVLYGLTVRMGEDHVRSYFGLRKVECRQDARGVSRIYLNNKPLFLYGPLDQGFWPDGIYTAPTDEALRYDLDVEKRLGFNCVRKHIKVEPARWYYWADRLGLCVWQDFPSVTDQLLDRGAPDLVRPAATKAEIETEMHRMVQTLDMHPSVIIWTAFNEGWGQYDTARVTKQFQTWDPKRLVDGASGWTDRGTGDFLDYHSYPDPVRQPQGGKRVAVQGEYGGGGLLVRDHVWKFRDSFQYRGFDDAEGLKRFVLAGVSRIGELARQGLGAAIYTQITDVEGEINGLMTYDRKVIKVPPEEIRPEVEAAIRAGSAESLGSVESLRAPGNGH